MMTLSTFLTKIRSCRGKLIKIKQNEKLICEDISHRIENDRGLLYLNDWNNVDHCVMMILAHYYTARTLDEPHAPFQVAAIIPEP